MKDDETNNKDDVWAYGLRRYGVYIVQDIPKQFGGRSLTVTGCDGKEYIWFCSRFKPATAEDEILSALICE